MSELQTWIVFIWKSYMAHTEDRRAASIAAMRDSWRGEAALQRFVEQHLKELV